MNAHFATRLLDAGRPLAQTSSTRYNSPPTSRPPARRCRAWSGSAYASRLYRELAELRGAAPSFSQQRRRDRLRHDRQRQLRRGDVLGVGQRRRRAAASRCCVSIWDDGYGISVPNEFQITKGDLSALLSGFQREPEIAQGYDLYTRQGLGLPGALRDLPRRRRDRAPRARAGDHPRHRGDAAAGALDLGQPRALQVAGAAGLGERVRLHPQDARVDDRAGHRHRRRARRAGGGGPRGACARRSAGPGTAYRAPIEEERRTSLALARRARRATAPAARSAQVARSCERQPAPLRRDLAAAAHDALIAARGDGAAGARSGCVAWQRAARSGERRALRLPPLQRHAAGRAEGAGGAGRVRRRRAGAQRLRGPQRLLRRRARARSAA